MNINLSGKRALICGSTDGIGKAAAILMAQRGAEIILAARNEEKLLVVQNGLEGEGHSYICSDFNNPRQLKEETENHLNKTGVVHILINNSGGPQGGPLLNAESKEFEAAFQRHVIACQLLSQLVVPGMKESGYGRIINIISMSVKQVVPGLGVSNIIRGAVAQWAKTLALELGGCGITVNNILPGYTNTERLKELFINQAKEHGTSYEKIVEKSKKMTALRRIGEPNETAAAIAFLSSEAAGYITGADFPIDGGRFGI